MSLHLFTQCELLKVISGLKNKRSCGFDEIPDFIVRCVGQFIVTPLLYVINKSFSDGVFPTSLKLSVVTPVFKKGDPTEIKNFRPISLLSVFHKIFELCMYDRLMSYLNHFKMLSPAQHGFRREFSTATAIDAFCDPLLDALESGEYPVGIFVDLSRAFDCINHTILLQKLCNYGIRGCAGDWFHSYLHDRRQCVRVGDVQHGKKTNCFSEVRQLSVGVPQGSILGPILFVLFVNDLPRYLEAPIVMYADDTSCVVDGASHNIEQRCNLALSAMHVWFDNHGLIMNGDKTLYTRYRSAHCRRDLSVRLEVNSQVLSHTDCYKFLGVHIDQNLNWSNHCCVLSKTIYKLSYQVRFLRDFLTLQQRISYYYACVQSRLCYGLCFWGSSPSFNHVFTAQKRVIRVMLGVSMMTPSRPLFEQLGILPMPCLYIRELLLYIYRKRHTFDLIRQIHTHATRNNNNIYVTTNRLNVTNKAPRHLGAIIFNKLPNHIQQSVNESIFKSNIKKHLLENMFYSLDDYMRA